jgi:hypothetical protein
MLVDVGGDEGGEGFHIRIRHKAPGSGPSPTVEEGPMHLAQV